MTTRTVTRPARKAGYHHGRLRRALLEASLTLIDKHGVEGLSLRAAARALGVTPGAPYHHFEDKDALLAALAEEGFRALHTALCKAGDACNAPRERAYEMGVAYVRFAVAHPTQFRLMMSRNTRRVMRHRRLSEAARAAYELTRQAVIDDVGSAEPAVVLASWSMVHGLAFLAIDGHLAGARAKWSECEPMVRQALRAMSPAEPD